MAIHFSSEEFARRRRAVGAASAKRELAGLLLFRQESMYYLTGFDSTGFTDFTAMLIGAGDELVLFCRPQERQLREHTRMRIDITARSKIVLLSVQES